MLKLTKKAIKIYNLTKDLSVADFQRLIIVKVDMDNEKETGISTKYTPSFIKSLKEKGLIEEV